MLASPQQSELAQAVSKLLVHHPHLQSRRVHFSANANGEVVIEGNVNSFFEKQLAQEAVRRVAGVRQVVNLLSVD